jgi:hypothetical protein
MRVIGGMIGALLACSPAFAADFAGEWQIRSSVNGNPVTIGCTLVQKGDTLSGLCRPEVDGIEPSEVTGAVEGTSAKWGYDVVFNGNSNHVDYQAELRADGMLTGTLFLGPMPTAFTASKQ